jgi:hypothetical protein
MFGYFNRMVPAKFYSVLMARLRNERPALNPAFTEVRGQLNARILRSPNDAPLLSRLAVLDALLDNKEAAISEAKRAAEMQPISREAFEGRLISKNLAVVYGWTNELDLAFYYLGSAD